MIYLSVCLMAFCWTLATFPVSCSLTQSVGLLGRGISPSQCLYLHTGQHRHRINTDIHASSGIRTHDPSDSVGEDSPCLRPRGHCDRWRWCITLGITGYFGFCPSFLIQITREQRFGKWIFFRPQLRRETPTLLGPIERANLSCPVIEISSF
jgi:hypothetical protein